ncbi:MAG: hypothetical protein K9J12_18520, partial [Melioribacteraceae bacterium]|nr:hypothetical protein [Melioribacteraceae bacterium]
MNNLYQRDINHLTPQNVNIRFLIIVLILVLISSSILEAQEYQKPDNLRKEDISPFYTQLNINNISTWVMNNGEQDINPNGNSGYEYPKGSNKQVIFQSGLVWGGIQNSVIKVGGSTYRSGLLPGRVLENGEREDETSDNVRIFRVRRDWEKGDLTSEMNDEGKSDLEIRNNYEKDWYKWPAEFGAPFEDVDRNGSYDPDIDIPGIQNADQTIWYVANDLDTAQTHYFYGADPLGLEIQVTQWGYKNIERFKNVIFRRYRVINKSSSDIDSMYLGYWVDADVGGAGDDLTGCDTTLNLAFTYNGENDPQYGNAPPAVGSQILQGPIVDGEITDSAFFSNKIFYGKKNLQMTAHHNFYKGNSFWYDPSFGDYEHGTLFMYNFMKGLGEFGKPYSAHFQIANSKFMHSGDPVTGEGWVDGILFPRGDRRNMISSGPFELAKKDTQEIIIAVFAAGYVENSSNIGAVIKLKHIAKLLRLEKSFVIGNKESPNKELNFQLIPLDKAMLINFEEAKEAEKLGHSNMYKFQGFNIYQFPSIDAEFTEAKKIATYDLDDGIKEIYSFQFENGYVLNSLFCRGNDTGIKRHIYLDYDFIQNTRIANGTELYYSVSAYFKTDFEGIATESYHNIKRAIPQSPKPGIRYNTKYGDEIWANRISGSSSAAVYAFIVDPSILTGNEYSLTVTDTLKGEPVWDLKNESTNTNLLSEYNNPDPNNDNPIQEGFLIEFQESKPFPGDKFTFTTPAVTYSIEAEKMDVDEINIFPNPYYGTHSNETGMYDRFITISHLPQRAVIRIFNLAGQLV